jgi:Cu-Zn family superoxide dismutase
MRKNKLMIFLSLLLVAGFLTSCKKPEEDTMKIESTMSPVKKAIAVINPASNSGVNGVVTFIQEDTGIRVVADIEGLEEGKHGIHVHEYGDCSAPDAKSAGGHFNPEDMPHGAPTETDRHVGDLGNIVAPPEGPAKYDRIDHMLSFSGDHSILGKAVVIHSGEDDLTSQPSGAAGQRLACGVIGVAKYDENTDK